MMIGLAVIRYEYATKFHPYLKLSKYKEEGYYWLPPTTMEVNVHGKE